MKTLDQFMTEFGPRCSYAELIESVGFALLGHFEEDDYQGHGLMILKNGRRYGFLDYSFGSCSGCDAIQACDTISDLESTRTSLIADCQWFKSKKACLDAITVKYAPTDDDWTGYHADRDKAFIALAQQVLGAASA